MRRLFFCLLMLLVASSACGFETTSPVGTNKQSLSFDQSDQDEDSPTEPDNDDDEPQPTTNLSPRQQCKNMCDFFCSAHSRDLGGCSGGGGYARVDSNGDIHCEFECAVGGLQKVKIPKRKRRKK